MRPLPIVPALLLVLLASCAPREDRHDFAFPALGVPMRGETMVWDHTRDRKPADVVRATCDSVARLLDAAPLAVLPVDSVTPISLWLSETLRVAELLHAASGLRAPVAGDYSHDPFRRTFARRAPDTRIELGAVRLGFAVDRCIGNLRELGLSTAKLDLGGIRFVLGLDQDGDPWSIDLADAVTLTTVNRAVATVGPVTVIDRNATMAAGLADVLAAMPLDQASALLTDRYGHVDAIFVGDGQVLATKGLAGNLRLADTARGKFSLRFGQD